MRNNFIKLIFYLIFSLNLGTTEAQSYFKKYIDSDEHCNEYNNQVLVIDGEYILINNITCDSSPEFSTIYRLNKKGDIIKDLSNIDIITNIHSGHIQGDGLFVAGTNSGINGGSKLLVGNANVNLEAINFNELDLFDPSEQIQLNPIGSIHIDQFKVVYGQYSDSGDQVVRSFFLWLDENQIKDTTIIFDGYDWSIISDATVDENGNLVVLIEAVSIINQIEHHFRIIHKYNPFQEKIFEWISPVFYGDQGLASISTIIPERVIIETVNEEDEYIHSIIAVENDGNTKWRWSFPSKNLFASYRISDIITSTDGSIICCGTYRNFNDHIPFTGFVIKLDKNGNIQWERQFVDNEELNNSQDGFAKVILFQSITENENGEIAIGGRVIHDYLLIDINSDLIFLVLDSNGCLTKDCGLVQEITRVQGFLDSNKSWTERYISNEDIWTIKYKFDTIPVEMEGNKYYRLLKSNSEFSENWVSAGKLIRYEGGRAYLFGGGSEVIIYDFNLVDGDTIHLGNIDAPYDLIVEKIDTVTLLNGDLKRRWTLQPVNPENPNSDNTIIWIEGIGNLKGFMTNYLPWTSDAYDSKILCVYWIDNIVYDDPIVDDCWDLSTSTIEDPKDVIFITPNPVKDEISIIGLEQDIEKVMIYNQVGILVYYGKEEHIQIDHFVNGYYILIVKLRFGEFKMAKFIKL